jgi:hypothetical protein
MQTDCLRRRSSTHSREPNAEAHHQEVGCSLEVSRREMLQAATWLIGSHFLASCGYIQGSDPGDSPALDGGLLADASGPADGALPEAGTADGGPLPHGSSPHAPHRAYRYQQRHLFQPIPANTSPSRLPDGAPYNWRINGVTNQYVDLYTGWAWKNLGGDWVDANHQHQGAEPWFSFDANAVSGSTAVHTYTISVTAALTTIQKEDRWNAYILQTKGAFRALAGTLQSHHPKPSIAVVYHDESSGELACLVCGALTASSSYTIQAHPAQPIPVAIEFERPTRAIKSATMSLTVVEHWSGAASIMGFVADPPINSDPLTTGLATAYCPLDEGITADPHVIGAHRYVDGTALSDFVIAEDIDLLDEVHYDPAIYGTGPTDLTKLPHYGLGKWVGANKGWSLVPSTYAGEGFAPLAPGLGAVRVQMEAVPGLTDGSIVGYSGTVAGNAKIFLPEPEFGVLKRIFVRYYMRLGAPYDTPFAKRYQVYNSPGAAAWTSMGGKTGITPAHDTSYGGTNGGSGGGRGWQMRLSWSDCDTGMGGPNDNAIMMGLHTYDFLQNNPVPYGSVDMPRDRGFGQRGGLGSVFYPGEWYCVEMEVDLNTVMSASPGYLEDGAVRVWIDGRLAFERTNMVMRALPLYSADPAPDAIRPVRELGHRDIWFNWFHGGKTQNSIDRTVFFTGLVWSRSNIGPMKM